MCSVRTGATGERQDSPQGQLGEDDSHREHDPAGVIGKENKAAGAIQGPDRMTSGSPLGALGTNRHVSGLLS